MDVVSWLQELGKSAGSATTFHARPLYVFCCVALPIAWGLLVGYLLRLAEAVAGIELGRQGAH